MATITVNIHNPRRKCKAKVKPKPKPKTVIVPPKPKPPPNRCKVAHWLYDWLYSMLDYLANTPEGNDALGFLNTEILDLSKFGLRRVIKEIIVGVIIALAGTPGPTLDDPVIIIAVIIIGEAIAWWLEDAGILPQYEVAEVEEIRVKIVTAQADIVCGLASSQGQSENAVFEAELDKLNLTTEQYLLCRAVVNPVVLRLLTTTAEWWPNFEADYLASVSSECCQ